MELKLNLTSVDSRDTMDKDIFIVFFILLLIFFITGCIVISKNKKVFKDYLSKNDYSKTDVTIFLKRSGYSKTEFIDSDMVKRKYLKYKNGEIEYNKKLNIIKK